MLKHHPNFAPVISAPFSSARFAMLAGQQLVYVIVGEKLVKQWAETDALPDSMPADLLYDHYRAAIETAAAERWERGRYLIEGDTPVIHLRPGDY